MLGLSWPRLIRRLVLIVLLCFVLYFVSGWLALFVNQLKYPDNLAEPIALVRSPSYAAPPQETIQTKEAKFYKRLADTTAPLTRTVTISATTLLQTQVVSLVEFATKFILSAGPPPPSML